MEELLKSDFLQIPLIAFPSTILENSLFQQICSFSSSMNVSEVNSANDIPEDAIISGSPPSETLMNENQFKIEFLKKVCIHFSSAVKEGISNVLELPECPKIAKIFISRKKINRMSVQELLTYLDKYSNVLCQHIKEDEIIFIFFKFISIIFPMLQI
jgi:hypothetical protein